MDVAVGVLAIVGASLVVLAGIGLLRFPDLYSRMHAAAKVPTLGVALIATATALSVSDTRVRSLLAVALLFVTAPAASHLVGRAAYRAEGIDLDLDGPDDLAELLTEETAEPPEDPDDETGG